MTHLKVAEFCFLDVEFASMEIMFVIGIFVQLLFVYMDDPLAVNKTFAAYNNVCVDNMIKCGQISERWWMNSPLEIAFILDFFWYISINLRISHFINQNPQYFLLDYSFLRLRLTSIFFFTYLFREIRKFLG